MRRKGGPRRAHSNERYIDARMVARKLHADAWICPVVVCAQPYHLALHAEVNGPAIGPLVSASSEVDGVAL